MIDTLYVSDLDGTLLTGDIRITDRTKDIINGLSGRMHFTVATARSAQSALPLIRGLELSLPLILHNGVLVMDPHRGECLRKQTIRSGTALEIIDAFRSNGINPLVYTYRAEGNRVLYHPRQSSAQEHYIRDRISRGDTRFLECADYSALDDIITVVGLDGFDTLDRIKACIESVDGVHIQFSKDLYFDYHWLEITHAEATKLHGVRFLKEYLGAQRVVCFGDHLNDLGLFEASDYRIAVANAVPELKERADLVIGGNNENAVAEYLNGLFSAK